MPAMSAEPPGSARGKPRFSKPQIQPAAELMRMKRPSVTIRIVSGSAFSTGRMSDALDRHPAEERQPERADQRQPERESGLAPGPTR